MIQPINFDRIDKYPMVLDPRKKKAVYSFPKDYISQKLERKILRKMSKN